MTGVRRSPLPQNWYAPPCPGVSHAVINKKAEKEGWSRKPRNVVDLDEIEKRRIARQQEINRIERANKIVREEAKRLIAVASKNPKLACLYIVECEHKGDKWQKIGRTSNFKDRVIVIQTSCPFLISVIKAEVVRDSVALEEYLHTLFAERRAMGEWFALSEEDITLAIRNIEANAIGSVAEIGAEGEVLCLD